MLLERRDQQDCQVAQECLAQLVLLVPKEQMAFKEQLVVRVKRERLVSMVLLD